MRWGLLGIDESLLVLAAQARQRGDHLVVVYEAGDHRKPLEEIAPAIRFATDDEWENLLHGAEVDAVLVGPLPTEAGDQERRHEQLRKLCQAGVPLLLMHPACDSIVGFELDMIRRDTQTPLVAYTAGMHHPRLAQLREWLRTPSSNPELGEIQQVVFERSLDNRTEPVVLRQLARDVLLLLQVVGEVKQVNAMGTFSNLSVQMGRRDSLLIRWNLAPGKEPAKLALLGAHGRLELELTPEGIWREPDAAESASPTSDPEASDPEASDPAALGPEALGPGGTETAAPQEVDTFQVNDDAHVALERIEQQIDAPRSEHHAGDPAEGAEVDSTWFAACRSSEIAEVIPRSLARGRTIELFYDDAPTEEATFKGMMAAGSCGILMLTLLILVVFSVIEGIRLPGLRSEYERDRQVELESAEASRVAEPASRGGLWWRLWPVYPIALFLGLQLLRLVFRTPSNRNEGRGAESSEARRQREGPTPPS